MRLALTLLLVMTALGRARAEGSRPAARRPLAGDDPLRDRGGYSAARRARRDAQILERGGNAVDAAIATQRDGGLMEPR